MLPFADTWYEIVLPPVVTLVVVAIGVVLLWLARSRFAQLVAELGVQRVSALGVDVEFTEQNAAEAYAKQGLGRPSEDDRATIRDAAQYLVPLVAQSRVLWVDDQPGGNEIERSTMLSWEVDVQAVRSTEDAVRELEDPRQRFDLIVSDWRRPGDTDAQPAGPALAQRVASLRLKVRPRVIFYHGLVDAPELARRRHVADELRAVGATGSPGELFRWCLIELSRVALDSPRSAQRQRRHRWRRAGESRTAE
jgi:CheY-like chemotaxis protein